MSGLLRAEHCWRRGAHCWRQTSRWHALPAAPAAHYRKTRIQLTQRQIIHVNDGAYPGGRATLSANHRYTLAYALTDRGLALTVIEEGTRPPDAASQP
ncbi:MAG: hypothetical protein EON49_08600 [Acidovorax sp.]|nr:MAG: hypothetical protein EON49_08600 [Acidovorax sp.]